VTADDGAWDSGLIEPGATWQHTFEKPGTYAFHCTPHPFMKGVVTVK
jgi:plastocyanin